MLYNTLLSLTKLNPILPKIVQQKEGPFVSIGRKTYESMGIKIEEEFDGLFYKVYLPCLPSLLYLFGFIFVLL